MKTLVPALILTLGACNASPKSSTTELTNAASSAASPTGRAPIVDSDIASAVKRLFGEDNALRGAPIQVDVKHGIATLRGTLPNLLSKKRAVAVAETIKGVRAIVDQMELTPVARTDQAIRADISRVLQHDPSTASRPIAVVVKDGAVTLSGTVDSWTQRNVLTDAAEEVAGVRAVDNRALVHGTDVRPAEQIAADVQHRVDNDVWLGSDNVHVVVHGHRAFLDGVVGSLAERRRAITDAWAVAGVDAVDDNGLLLDWMEKDRQRAIQDVPPRTDGEIAAAVRDAFKYDERLKRLEPQVAVQAGMVTLKGLAQSPKARQAAAEDAQDTLGVWGVNNEMLVEPGGPPADKDLEAAVKRAVVEDLLVPDGKSIDVKVSNGHAVLSGTVHASYDRVYAVIDATNVPGIVAVDDRIVVQLPAGALQAAIEDRLSWDPRVEREHITVAVSPGGVATLTGQLATWSDVKAATDDALAAGATRVTNMLKIAKHPDAVFPK